MLHILTKGEVVGILENMNADLTRLEKARKEKMNHTEAMRDQLMVLCEPVIEYLNRNYHPHAMVIVEQSGFRLMQQSYGVAEGARDLPEPAPTPFVPSFFCGDLIRIKGRKRKDEPDFLRVVAYHKPDGVYCYCDGNTGGDALEYFAEPYEFYKVGRAEIG